MRVPLAWLAEHVDLPDGARAVDVAASLVRVGLEEEAVHGGDVTGPLVVGTVLELVEEPQKNGKTIRWCSVDVGEEQARGIVCGAANFDVGDVVVVALPGAVLPGGFSIAARKTYGHVSDGMIASARELGLGDDHTGIIVLSRWGIDAAPGADALVLLGLAGRHAETVEVEVTPDRGYCLSIRGIAREYGHATGAAFRDPAHGLTPDVPAGNGFAVHLEDESPIRGQVGGDRFVARAVRGVDAHVPSPWWMQRRLIAAGMRPVGLAVDVTNYVMQALGQPLHAFDLATLDGSITVRRTRPGERLTTLDGVDRALHPEDLVVADGPGGARAVSLAGVMGGAATEIGQATTDVLLEAAHWDPVTIARTTRRHKLSSEASRRFERGVDPALGPAAIEMAARLLVEHGGGTPDATWTDEHAAGTDPLATPAIEMARDLPARLVGVPYEAGEVTEALRDVGCEVTEAGAVLVVSPPTWRPDLRAGADLVEEVARLRGYERIPSVLPVAPAGRGLSHRQRVRRVVAGALAAGGFVEVLSYPFVSPSVHDAMGLPPDDPRRMALRLANPLREEQPELRTSLLASLLDTVRRNAGRGETDLAVFEAGLVTRPDVAPGQRPAARLPMAARPSDEDLAALVAAVPPQPERVAVVLAGDREASGWDGPSRPVKWSDAVGAVQLVATTLGVTLSVRADAAHPPWHPGRCAALHTPDGDLVGHAGELHPRVVAALELPRGTCAAELDLGVLAAQADRVARVTTLSRHPVAKEDVALVVADDVPAGDVEAAVREGAGALLEDVRLFDVYIGEQVGPGHRSLAYRLRLRAHDRTLTATEVATVRDAVVAAAHRRTGAVLRGTTPPHPHP